MSLDWAFEIERFLRDGTPEPSDVKVTTANSGSHEDVDEKHPASAGSLKPGVRKETRRGTKGGKWVKAAQVSLLVFCLTQVTTPSCFDMGRPIGHPIVLLED